MSKAVDLIRTLKSPINLWLLVGRLLRRALALITLYDPLSVGLNVRCRFEIFGNVWCQLGNKNTHSLILVWMSVSGVGNTPFMGLSTVRTVSSEQWRYSSQDCDRRTRSTQAISTIHHHREIPKPVIMICTQYLLHNITLFRSSLYKIKHVGKPANTNTTRPGERSRYHNTCSILERFRKPVFLPMYPSPFWWR